MLHKLRKMGVRLLVHFLRLVIHGMAVDGLQDTIGRPSATLHDVCVRNAEGVLNRCGVVPEVVETEVRNVQAVRHPLEHLAKRVRVHVHDTPGTALPELPDKFRVRRTAIWSEANSKMFPKDTTVTSFTRISEAKDHYPKCRFIPQLTVYGDGDPIVKLK